MNRRAVDLIADRLTNGLPHPGDPDANMPAKLLAPLPAFRPAGLSPEQAATFAKEAGLPDNDAAKLYAEALVHALQTDGGMELVDKAHLQQLKDQVATPQEANAAAPVVEVLDSATRQVILTVATGRAQVLVDGDAIRGRIEQVRGGA